MKANTIMALKKIIKETVEKEVAKQIQIVIKEITSPAPSQSSTQPVKEKIKVKDPVLNKILNETQGGIGADDDYPTMGGGVYTSDRTHELGMGSQAQIQDPNMPDFMKKAMSGHSAKVVDAIGKKNGTRTN